MAYEAEADERSSNVLHPPHREDKSSCRTKYQTKRTRTSLLCLHVADMDFLQWYSVGARSEHGRCTIGARSEHGRSTVEAQSMHDRSTVGARSEHGRSTLEAESKHSRSTVGARSEHGRSTTCVSQLTNVTDEPEWSHCMFLVCYEQEQFNHVAAKSFWELCDTSTTSTRPRSSGFDMSPCVHDTLLMGGSHNHFATKLKSNSLCENSHLVLMIVVRRFDKLKHILQQCSASKSMSEHAHSVMPERVEEALTTGKEFHEKCVNDVIDAAQKRQKCMTTTPSSYYLHIDLYTGTCACLSILKDEQSSRYHILASTFAASKLAWRSSGLHGWCETYFVNVETDFVLILNRWDNYSRTPSAPQLLSKPSSASSSSSSSSSATNFEIYAITDMIWSFASAASWNLFKPTT